MKKVNFVIFEFLPNQEVTLNGKDAVIEDCRVPEGMGYFEYLVDDKWLPGFAIDAK